MSTDNQLLALVAERQRKLMLRSCFDAELLDSRPNAKQWEFFNDIKNVRFRWVVAGNQCLAEGTLVATPKGPTPIEQLCVGDTVYSEHGKEIKIIKTHFNGIKSVRSLTCRNKQLAECTDEHVWLTTHENGKIQELKTSELTSRHYVLKRQVKSPLGNVHEPHAYAMGALLGDGCCREDSLTRISISSEDHVIPEKVCQVLEGTNVYRQHILNYTWRIQCKIPGWYKDHLEGKYAHEKFIPLDIIKSWDRESLLNYVAGLLDTDGSVSKASDHVSFALGMQAKEVVDSFRYAVLALWQVDLSFREDARSKYKNGSVWVAYTRNSNEVKLILSELGPYLALERKRWKPEYEGVGGMRSSLSKTNAHKSERTRLAYTYDITVDSETNLYLLANGMVTHNSGKSSSGARELAWILNDDHPHWKRPDHWGTGPLKVIVAGKSRDILTIELWRGKLKPLLTGNWKEIMVQRNIVGAENEDTGDYILFLCHGDGSDLTIDRMQGYVAHYVWCDEMPAEVRVLTELQMRVNSRQGYFVGTFTPLAVNSEIKNMVDASDGKLSKRYIFTMFDNPRYAGREDEIWQQASSWPVRERRARLFGEWYQSDSSVYELDRSMVVVNMPSSYSPAWRHHVSVDPALSSNTGLGVYAEDPATGVWYCIRADYIKEKDPDRLWEEIWRQVKSEYANLNISRCSTDVAPWFQALCTKNKVTFLQPYNKTQRKDELIKNLQSALSSGTLKLVAGKTDGLLDEFETCRYSDSQEGKIVAGQKYHLLDQAQYFIDTKIKSPAPIPTSVGRDEIIMQMFEKQKQQEAAAKANAISRVQRRRSRWSR
jgi:phage terminase large subunit-like protein